MMGILGSGMLLLISIILRVTLGSLTDKFDFLESWLPYFTYIIIGFAIITLIFVVAVLIKMFKKSNSKE